jgi:hypothetical protein
VSLGASTGTGDTNTRSPTVNARDYACTAELECFPVHSFYLIHPPSPSFETAEDTVCLPSILFNNPHSLISLSSQSFLSVACCNVSR